MKDAYYAQNPYWVAHKHLYDKGIYLIGNQGQGERHLACYFPKNDTLIFGVAWHDAQEIEAVMELRKIIQAEYEFESKQEPITEEQLSNLPRPLVNTEYQQQLGSILSAVGKEVKRARSIHEFDFNSRHEGYAVILEEVDELWAEVKKKNPHASELEKEAIQAAAMLVRFAIECC